MFILGLHFAIATFWCNVSSVLRISKIIEIGPCLTVILKKQKGDSFWDTVYLNPALASDTQKKYTGYSFYV